jgi:hypothetical protein
LFVSPGGDEIAFLSPGNGQLMRVSVNGGTPLPIVAGLDNFLGATWGRDDIIIFSTGNALWRVSAAGGSAAAEIPTTWRRTADF